MTYRLHVTRIASDRRPAGLAAVWCAMDVDRRIGEVWRERHRWYGCLGYDRPAETGPHPTRYAAFMAVTDLHEAKEGA